MDHQLLSFLIRWIHTASMAFMLGGALLVWALSLRHRGPTADEHNHVLVFIAQRYELLFWIAIGVQVITGIGNLGAFGNTLPAAGTAWGIKLTLKLLAVLLFILLSLPRSLLFAFAGRFDEAAGSTWLSKAGPVLYAGTAVYLAVILFLAVSLAHG